MKCSSITSLHISDLFDTLKLKTRVEVSSEIIQARLFKFGIHMENYVVVYWD